MPFAPSRAGFGGSCASAPAQYPRNDNCLNKLPSPKEKGPTFVGPECGDKLPATGPIPPTPGGWGLRNPEPKGPGLRSTFLSQFTRAVDGRKFGSIMISLTIP